MERLQTIYSAHRRPLQGLLILLSCLALYSNSFDHAFQLDSPGGLVNNSYVRSLTHIPSYFTDPLTLTSHRSNGDYRPILQISYAINYAISGYDMWSWHLVQILLHVLCALCVFRLCERLLHVASPPESGWLSQHLPLIAGLLFAVHPASSGVVNYLWARSSLLCAAFLFPSVLIYMRSSACEADREPTWGVALLYGLALFTKVEAVAVLAVYFLWEMLARSRREGSQGFVADVRAAANPATFQRLRPMLVITLVYAVLRELLVPDFLADARHAADAHHLHYLFTQLTAWWHYVLRWFAPVELVADHLSYPHYDSLLASPVLLALAGWTGVAVVLHASYQKAPEYCFLAVSALALISPTSSFMPLSEMVNEHRPYLPFAFLSLTWILAASSYLGRSANPRLQQIALVALGLLLCALASTTWERNRVFATTQAYWSDINEKAPSARSNLNLGVTFLREAHYEKALTRFKEAERLAPEWHYIHTNLGLVYEQLGELKKATKHFDKAVAADRHSSEARVYRGEFHLRQKQHRQAFEDFDKSLELAREVFPIHVGRATAAAGLGRWKIALESTLLCLEEDRQRTEKRIVIMSTPFWAHRSVYSAGIKYYRALLEHLPDRWYLYENLGHLAARLGRKQEATKALQRAKQLSSSRTR